MDETGKQRPLTREEKDRVWTAIASSMRSDDKPPRQVIAENYDGDEERYLRIMAKWHSVPLDD